MAEAANDRDREAAVAKAKKQRRSPTAEAAE
jgi:hypothetical protein